MKKIYKATVLMANSELLQTRIANAIASIKDSSVVERFLDIVFDCDTKIDELPKYTMYSGWTCTLISFDYLNDRVDFKKEKLVTRYFKNQKDADNYTATGDYSWNNYKNSSTDEYNIAASWYTIENSYTSTEEWIGREVIEK